MENLSLYEIDDRINDILSRNVDEETGIITDEALKEIESLEMHKKNKLENCAKAYFQAKADESACADEITRLAERKKRAASKAERILDFLAFISNGEKTDCGIATLSFPKPLPSLVEDDKEATVNWLEHNGYGNMVTKIPKISAKDVKALVLGGHEIPGVHIEYKERRQLK